MNSRLSQEIIWPQMIACISAASLHFSVGTVIGFTAILVPQLQSPDSDIKVTKEDISWIASIVALLMPVGTVMSGYLVDKIGRINTLRLTIIPYISGWVCLAMAENLNTILIGRVLTGLSTGLASNPAVVYITEVARPKFRGALICTATSSSALGILITYTEGAFLHWRTITWLSIAYCALPVLLMSIWSPESPVWLISKGRTDDALNSIKQLFRSDRQADTAEQRLEEMMKHCISPGQADQEGWAIGKLLQGLSKPTGYKPFLLMITIFIFQQCSGLHITIYYSVYIFQSMGTNIDPYISSIGIGGVKFIMGLVTVVLMRNVGRRPLFMISSFGMAVFVFTSGYFSKQIAEGQMEKNLIPVICMLLYVSFGIPGFMSIPYTMSAELFPLEIRGMAQSLSVIIVDFILFFGLKLYPFLEDYLGGVYAVQWLFAGVSFSAVIFLFVFLPETHGKELIEIQEYFKSNMIYIFKKDPPTTIRVPEYDREEIIRRNDAP